VTAPPFRPSASGFVRTAQPVGASLHPYPIGNAIRKNKEIIEMKRKILLGTLSGVVAGALDVTPMIIQKLPIQSMLSAFSMGVVLGLIINTSSLKIKGVLKGLLLSFLVLLPNAFLIGYEEPIALIPIGIMTVILGTLLGFVSDKLEK
jgi:hypothetical protein